VNRDLSYEKTLGNRYFTAFAYAFAIISFVIYMIFILISSRIKK